MFKILPLLFFNLLCGLTCFAQDIEVLLNEGHKLLVNDAVFSIDDKTLFTAGSDHQIIEWNANLLKQKRTYNGHKATVNVIAYDERNLYSGGIFELFRWTKNGEVELQYKMNGTLTSLNLWEDQLIVTTKDQILIYDKNKAFPLNVSNDITGIQCATIIDFPELAVATKNELFIFNLSTNTVIEKHKLNTIDKIKDIDFDDINNEIVLTGQNFGHRFNLKFSKFLETTEPYFLSSTISEGRTFSFDSENRNLNSFIKNQKSSLPNSSGPLADKLQANNAGDKILLYGYGEIHIYDLKYNRYIESFKSERLSIQKFSLNQDKIALGVGTSGEARIFDLKKMMFTSFIQENNETVTAAQLSDEDLFISSYDDVFSMIKPSDLVLKGQINSSDISKGIPENYVEKSRYQKLADGFSSDKVHYILKNSDDELYLVYNYEVKLLSISKKKFINIYNEEHSDLISHIIKLNDNTFATAGLDKNLIIWDKETSKKITQHQFDERIISIFPTNNNSIKIYLKSGRVMLYNYNSEAISQLSKINSTLQLVDESEDNKIVYSNGRVLSLGKVQHENSSEIVQLKCIDSDKLITRHADHKLKVWDYNKGLIATIIATNEGQIIYTPDGYYWGDKKSVNQIIHFKYQGEIFLFNQFDVYFNRPDIILKRIGLADSSYIKIYESAIEKRIQMSGQTGFKLKAIPEFSLLLKEFEDENIIWIDEDKANKESDYKIYINDVLYNGKIKSTGSRREISIPKSNINLKIDVILHLKNGVKSLPKTVYIYPSKIDIPTKKHIILLGSSEFNDPQFNLKYPTKDLNDIKNFYKSNFKNTELIFHQLENNNLTLKNIENIKNEINNKESFNDEIIVYYAGHGILDDELEYYLSCGETDFQNPVNTAIKFTEFQNILTEINVLKKVLFIDACHGGEFDKQEVKLTVVESVEENELVFRGMSSYNYSIPKSSVFELTKTIFNDVRESAGLTIISSSSGDEYALESDQWKNGLFTYTLLQGLNNFQADENGDNSINLSEILSYCSKYTYKLSNGKQQPSVRTINTELDFSLISK